MEAFHLGLYSVVDCQTHNYKVNDVSLNPPQDLLRANDLKQGHIFLPDNHTNLNLIPLQAPSHCICNSVLDSWKLLHYCTPYA